MNQRLEYQDDPTAQEIFTLAGRALADPADSEPRRDFWRLVDRHGDHEWVKVLKKSAAASHPHGLAEGQKLLGNMVDDAYSRKYAFQPDWLKGVYQTFERG